MVTKQQPPHISKGTDFQNTYNQYQYYYLLNYEVMSDTLSSGFVQFNHQTIIMKDRRVKHERLAHFNSVLVQNQFIHLTGSRDSL